MADWFVGPVMEKLIDACFEYLKDQVRWQTGMKEELEELRFILPRIQAVVSAYSQVEIEDPALNKCLWQLRDAIDEADDVLDELEYRKREEQVWKNNKIRKVRSLMKSLKKRFVKIGKRALKVDHSLKELEVAVQKLHKISAEVSTFHRLFEGAKREQQQQQLELKENREEGSMPTNDLLGRSEEMEFIRRWLRKPYQTENTNADLYSKISLLSVVGLGGMGKTTLLQHVYKDVTLNKDGMAEKFDVKMWICVSTNFKAKTVIANILKSLKIEGSDEEPLEELQIRLQSELVSKRFLLVLDDIWEADETKWKKVLAPLHYGSSGGKILITTRMDSIASEIAKMIKKSKEILPLKGLKEDEFLQLFSTHAFAGVENPDDEFRSITLKMVKKLSGCPLAAKVFGGILNLNFDKHYWRNILNTNIGKIEPNQNELLPILKLSYIYLPKFLKNCFSFCCIFPQDYEFDKDDLVRMWIALGFIQSSDIQGETLEDIGKRYFNILVDKSFFDGFYNNKNEVYYKMHDLLHELAQSVSKEECFRILDNKELSIPPKTTRHLFICIRSFESLEAVLTKLGEFKNLRSLFLPYCFVDENLISKIFRAYKSIRLLVINAPYLPKTTDSLIHLRYLKVKCRRGFEIPRSISHLYHLQFIISNKFVNLEMDNIGWKGYNWLQGGIYIRNSPNLIHLTGRQELKINENCQLITDEFVIKGPSVLPMEPLSLHFLKIEKNDQLVSFSSETEQWFTQQSSSLSGLEFHKLQSLRSLPSSLESLSSLQTLEVWHVPQLKLLPNPPPSLTNLSLYHLKSLQCLPSSLSTISSLHSLTLSNIPFLKSLPDLPSSLALLRLDRLENLDCLPSCFPNPLNILRIAEVPRLLELPDLPSSLTELRLSCMESLKCLPSCLPPPLNTLTIDRVLRLLELPDLPPSLTELRLSELVSLQRLPSCLPTSLKMLWIYKVPRLLELPDLPASLNLLHIAGCHPQLEERCQNFNRARENRP